MSKMKKLISILTFLSFIIVSLEYVAFANTNIINEYDANGNLVTGDGKYYEYNDANQLVKVRQGDQSGTVIAEYFYNFAGRRVKKIENGVTTYYVGSHYEKQVGGANAGDSKYYFAGGERVAKKDPSGNIQYYHLDHLGGTNAVTDQAGNDIASINYYPFGETKPGSSVNEKYSYTGKEKDNTPGLYYFKSRYNHPEFRHFTQPDTIIPDLSNPQSLNRYSYVENNPVSYVDPDGHKKKKKRKKRGGLSKREYKCKKMGLNPDTCKKKLKKKKKKRGGLSKREAWMIAHGRNPDKDKTPLKIAKKQNHGKKLSVFNVAQQFRGGDAELISDVTSSVNDDNVRAGLIALGTTFPAEQNIGRYQKQWKFGERGGSRLGIGLASFVLNMYKGITSGASGNLGYSAIHTCAAIYSFGEIAGGSSDMVIKRFFGKEERSENINDELLGNNNLIKLCDEASIALTLGGL